MQNGPIKIKIKGYRQWMRIYLIKDIPITYNNVHAYIMLWNKNLDGAQRLVGNLLVRGGIVITWQKYINNMYVVETMV